MYYNRDISWLGFNERVLQEAADPEVPLMERIKFLSIFSANLDEFFRVRFPAIAALSGLNSKIRKRTIPPTSKNLAKLIKDIVNKQFNNFGSILREQLLPGLETAGIVLYYDQPLKEEHIDEVKEFFLSNVLSFIQPLFINDDFTKNFIPENDRPYFLITIKQAGISITRHAVVNIPSDKLPRFFSLSALEGKSYLIFIDDIIRENLNCLFPGFEILTVSSFKINRDAELLLEESLGKDILREIEKKLEKRKMGKLSRFLFQQNMPQSLQMYLSSVFHVKDAEMFEGGRYHDLKDLINLPVKNDSLYYPVIKRLASENINISGDIFEKIKERDILLHFPYQSYNPILSFFNQAAIDPNVRSIYITLYRIASDSHIANALISAAKNGKEVVVFVELKARFDEANNIMWSKAMKKAGIRIIYSIPGIKVHSKIALVKKDKDDYALIGTGNFNEKTAQLYADHTLLTSDPSITDDLKKLFNCLQRDDCKTALKHLEPEQLLISQVNMVSSLERLIKEQISIAKKQMPACISLKMNSLEDPGIIQLLYKASRAGVKVRLMVRGICCLIPGRKNLSENIEVKRIVDRYLEHSRIFIFGEAGNSQVFIGSADCMTRNLHYRVEAAVPVKAAPLKEELETYFELQWTDNTKAVTMDEKNVQHFPVRAADEIKIRSQDAIYDFLKQKHSL
ncbi:MAG: polyphosphate kinase 1 [Ferruginibacter sp.]